MNPLWDQEFMGDVLAFAIHNDSDARLSFAAASVGRPAVIVSPALVGRFLEVHADAEIVSHDAGQLHWSLHRELDRRDDTEGLRTLWRFSRKCRLHDVMLMDQRLCLVERAVYSMRKELGQLPQDLHVASQSLDSEEPGCSSTLESRAASSQGLAHQAASKAKATIDAYDALRGRMDLIARNLGISSELVARFGPLGLGIDVQGAIALRSATQRGLLMNANTANKAYQAAEELYRVSSASLATDKVARQGFEWTGEDAKRGQPILHWKGRTVHRNAEGLPRLRGQKLRDWLWTLFSQLRDLHGGLRVPPIDEAERLSTDPEHWGGLIRCHPLLVAWRDLTAAAEIRSWFQSLSGFEVHPEYGVVPQLQSAGPNLRNLRRLGQSLFRPRPGRIFLIGRFSNLGLSCFGVLCEARYRPGGSLIANTFRAGDDPVAEIAAVLFASEAGTRPGDAPWDFCELETSNPGEHRRWVETSRVLLHAMPRCLTTSQIRRLLREALPNCEFQEADVERFQANICDVVRELRDFLEDNTYEVLARKLGVDKIELEKALWMPDFPGTMGQALRNVLADKRVGEPVWERLRSLAKDGTGREIVEKGKGGIAAYSLLINWPITLSGRVGRPGYCNQPRTTEYLDLADEVMKVVAFKLVSVGYELVAVVDNEFVLEVADDLEDVTGQVESLADSAVEEVLSWAPDPSCSCQMADTW